MTDLLERSARVAALLRGIRRQDRPVRDAHQAQEHDPSVILLALHSLPVSASVSVRLDRAGVEVLLRTLVRVR